MPNTTDVLGMVTFDQTLQYPTRMAAAAGTAETVNDVSQTALLRLGYRSLHQFERDL